MSHTPREILEDALDYADDMEVVVVVAREKNGSITIGHSYSDGATRIGLLEVAKSDCIETIEGRGLEDDEAPDPEEVH